MSGAAAQPAAEPAGHADPHEWPRDPVSGSKVGIVGGSIAGCAAAIALHRLGCQVTVLERSSSGLKDRGSGIAVPAALKDELIDHGYLPDDYAFWSGTGRRWYAADGSPKGSHRWLQPGIAVTNNWGELWRGLRSNVPDDVVYRDGVGVTGIEQRDEDVELTLTDGTTDRFDVVLGADGYRSVVSEHLFPDASPTYPGYVLWRGNFNEGRLVDTEAWCEVVRSGEWLTVGFDGGHGVMYPIPDFGAKGGGKLRVNWAIYAPTPAGLTIDGPSSIAPGMIDDNLFAQFERLVEETIPPLFRPVFASTRDELSIQPIYDKVVPAYTSGRLALIGDAATLSRPHTGSGATKAIQDARLLETLGATHPTWDTLLAAYDDDRSTTGLSLVEMGRRIGAAQVEHTPPWLTMEPADFEEWAASTLDGDSLYFWGDDEPLQAEEQHAD